MPTFEEKSPMKKVLLISLGLFFLLFLTTHGEIELLGELSKKQIFAHSPDWEKEAAAYSPNPEIIEGLNHVKFEVKIEIVLGIWCPDAKRNVSAYFKIMDMTNNPLITTTLVGIPKEKAARKPYIEGKNIQRVPTFIIIVGNEEKGRIIENPVKSIEEDLLDIISGSGVQRP